jgi:NTE family protein
MIGSPPPAHAEPDRTGDVAIVLTGGGARAAYQVGFLRWIARHIPAINFPIITGVSAGAINAGYIAAFPGTQAEAIERLANLWQNLSVEQVFRVDTTSLLSNMARWGIRLISGGMTLSPKVRGLVDTAPLRETLNAGFKMPEGAMARNIEHQLAARRLCALAIITSNYTTGQSVAWIQGRDLRDWDRPTRRSRTAEISLDHIMASAALPLFFPAIHLAGAWHGDGGIRLTAPCSPAIHLGATRILALSTRHAASHEEADRPMMAGYPSPLQISGQLLDAIFLDDLDRDAQELKRINMLLRDVPTEKHRGLRPIQLMIARPSKNLSELVVEFESRLPRFFRHLTRSLGSRETSTPDLLSLLAFDPDYLSTLIQIGETDAAARADEIRTLLGVESRE